MSQIPLPDITVPASEMKLIGTLAINITRNALLQGKMSDNRTNLQYTKEYAKYKANGMRRFTRGGNIQEFTNIKQGGIYSFKNVRVNTKKLTAKGKGQKLNGYETRSVNTDVSKVNLTLTGDMVKSLSLINANVNHIRVTFSGEQTKKILGNIANGYNPVGLNSENTQIIKNYIIKYLEGKKPKGTFNFKV